MQGDGEHLFFQQRGPEPACRAPNHAKLSDEVATGTSMTTPRTRQLTSRLRTEWQLPVSVATTALFLVFGNRWLADLSDPVWFAFLLGWLFAAILVSAFAVVRHAEGLAVRLGEPLGTLVLTLSMSGIEMMMIAAVMYTGQDLRWRATPCSQS
jgi:hypothetical protein